MRHLTRFYLLKHMKLLHNKFLSSTTFLPIPSCSKFCTSIVVYNENILPGYAFEENLQHNSKEDCLQKSEKSNSTKKTIRKVETNKENDENLFSEAPETSLKSIQNGASITVSPTDKSLFKINHPVWRQLRPQPEDLELVNRSDFDFHSLSCELPPFLNIDTALAEGIGFYNMTKRITGMFFMFNVLLPLERRTDSYLTSIRQSPDSYLPVFMQWCGNALSDVEIKNRMKIIERFIKAIRSNDLPMTLPLINNMMSVYIQNDHYFEPHTVLELAERELNLTVDKTFYNFYVWQMAKKRSLDANSYSNIRYEMGTRNIFPDVHTQGAHIYGLAKTGDYALVKSLINQANNRFGGDAKRLCIGAGLIGFSSSPLLLDMLKKLLNESLLLQNTAYRLNANIEDIFAVIWNLARNSEDGFGKEHAELITKLISYTHLEPGVYSLFFREIQRHLVHEFYYSALALLDFQTATSKIPDFPDTLDTFRMKMSQKNFANQIIKKNLPPSLGVDLVERLSKVFGDNIRFCGDLVYAILTSNKFDSVIKRYEILASYIDLIDPNRERPYLILPFLAKYDMDYKEKLGKDIANFRSHAAPLNDKCRMLYLFANSLLYKNFANSDAELFCLYILNPLFQNIKVSRNGKISDRDIIDTAVIRLTSFGLIKEDIKNLLCKVVEKHVFTELKTDSIINWLQQDVDLITTPKKSSSTDSSDLKKFISNKDIEKTHDFLVKHGLPEDLNLKSIIDPLLNLYLDKANLGFLHKFLLLLSETSSNMPYNMVFDFDFDSKKPSSPISHQTNECIAYDSPIQNHHLLKILLKRYTEMSESSIDKLTEYTHHLKKLFPHSSNEKQFECNRAFRDLFKVLLRTPIDTTQTIERVQKCADFIKTLSKLQLIWLSIDETLTPYFVNEVLQRFGADYAIDAWMDFQEELYCSNALVPLLQYSMKKNNNDQIEFLLYKARRSLEVEKLDAYYAAVLVNMKKFEDADSFFRSHAPIKSQNCTSIFSIMLNFNYNNQPKLEFTVEFLKLLLKHTDLKNDKEATKKIFHSWIRTFGQTKEIDSLFTIYELLKPENLFPTLGQMKELSDIFKPSQELFNQWIDSPSTGLLNAKLVDSHSDQEKADFEERIRTFNSDYDLLKLGGVTKNT